MNNKESVLIASSSKKFKDIMSDLLPNDLYELQFASTITKTEKAFNSQRYDYIIINAPLSEDPCVSLSIKLSKKHTSVILMLVPDQTDRNTINMLENKGILILKKPLSINILQIAIQWMKSVKGYQTQSDAQLETLRLITRAKCLLIENKHMSEAAAHRYIEKYSMDNSLSKKETALKIINFYK